MSGSGAEADTEGQAGEPVGAAGGDRSTLSPASDKVPEAEKSPVGQLLETDHRVSFNTLFSVSSLIARRWVRPQTL